MKHASLNLLSTIIQNARAYINYANPVSTKHRIARQALIKLKTR